VAGQLTPAWRVITMLVWALVFVGLLAVSSVSRQLGLATWWLGPLGEPRPFLVQIVPFVPTAAVMLAVANNSRAVPWVALAGSLGLAAVGAADLGHVVGLGLVQLAIAAAAAIAAVASFDGRYR